MAVVQNATKAATATNATIAVAICKSLRRRFGSRSDGGWTLITSPQMNSEIRTGGNIRQPTVAERYSFVRVKSVSSVTGNARRARSDSRSRERYKADL